MSYIDSARAEGAAIMTAGEPGDGGGYHVRPTAIADVELEMGVMREEIFGPMLCACLFADLDEVARLANDTKYGLAATIWTRDVSICTG